MADYLQAYPALADQLAQRGIDVEAVKAKLHNQAIETPSWGYGNSGTRFKVFPWPGAARAAEYRGCCRFRPMPCSSLHRIATWNAN